MNDGFAKPTFFRRLRNWVSTHRTRTIVFLGIILIAAAGVTAYALLSQNSPALESLHLQAKPKPAPPAPVFYSPLTGVKVPDEASTKQAVTAIMIENSPDARPQSGLKQAGVVYEAIAEGGITRFLTLHQEDKPQVIGPVRSLRMYYVDWLAPYNASVAHVGGSAAALAEIRNGKYRDIDQFFNGGSYWRATDRYAPHNVYTSFAKLDALNAAKGYTSSTFTGFPRADGKPAAKPTASVVTINFSGALYNTAYGYDPGTNSYYRSVGGKQHMDREEGQIHPSVVIAMKVNMHKVFEDGYREDINANSTGQANLFQNGTMQEVTWSKPSRESQITFKDENGKEVPLVRGQTWITAVPNGTGSVSWQ
ncbi:MAG TPA: DUF3048 domain-containing protein [Candidatus Saccharimonadales bacterium]|nr:DUF3048 domain-containing protein [Candidatus Saccharimonadales bacterium]